MKRWSNWHTLKTIQESITGKRCRGYQESFDCLVFDDYRRLKLDDPAVKYLFNLAGVHGTFTSADKQRRDASTFSLNSPQGDLGAWCIEDLDREFAKQLSRTYHAPGVAGYESWETAEIETLLAFRKKKEGWRQLDRLYKHATGRTLSDIVDQATFVFDPKDPGLDGDVCYSLGFDLGYDLEDDGFKPSFAHAVKHIAMASTPEILLQLLEKGRLLAGKQLSKKTGLFEQVDFVEIYKNNEKVCTVEIRDEVPCWSKTHWIENSQEVMLAINQVAPKAEGLRMKAKYLDDALGL